MNLKITTSWKPGNCQQIAWRVNLARLDPVAAVVQSWTTVPVLTRDVWQYLSALEHWQPHGPVWTPIHSSPIPQAWHVFTPNSKCSSRGSATKAASSRTADRRLANFFHWLQRGRSAPPPTIDCLHHARRHLYCQAQPQVVPFGLSLRQDSKASFAHGLLVFGLALTFN